jgi:hypothetical protein
MDKCHNCKKKNHVLIECKCGHKVCLKCKVPEDHQCTFDFKFSAQYRLALNNPKIQSKKIEQI